MADKTGSQIRLDDKLWDELKKIADLEYRSINAQMEYFLSRSVAAYWDEHRSQAERG